MARGGKLLIAGASLLAVVAAVLGLSMIETVRPRDMTRGRLLVLWTRIILFASEREAVPQSLSDLPSQEGKDNAITDGWGHDIILSATGTTVTLTSFEKDGVPGGKGEDADLTLKFAIPEKGADPVVPPLP